MIIDKKMIVDKKLALRVIQAKCHEKYVQPSVVIELLPYSQQAEAARRWQELEQRTGNTLLTNSWLWTKTWLEYHGDIVQPVFAFGRQGDQIIGAALIVTATYRRKRMRFVPISRVHVGTGKYTEYNRLLVVPDHRDSFATVLVKTIQSKFRWSELHFDGFVSEDADALLRGGKKAGLLFQVQTKRTPIFDFQQAMDAGYQDVLSALGKNTRYNIRRSRRLFEDTYGPLTMEWAETEEQAKAILKELIDMHQARWTRVRTKSGATKSGAFDKPHLRAYYVSLIETLKLWPHGSVIVCRVKAGETTLGCIFHYIENGNVMFTKGGVAQFEDAKLKPGFITHVACMEECRRRGFTEGQQPALLKYDFLTGDESYKDSLTNTGERLIWATAERGFLVWLIEQARVGRSILRRITAIRGVRAAR